MRIEKLGPVRTYSEVSERLHFSGSYAILFRFFLQPLFLVLGRASALIGDDPGGRRRNSRIASRAPRLGANIQNFLFAPLHGPCESSC
jgi:hypothetical protein